tara:strand:+ start:145 stop:318 length:174 start_codon:yes stop_codon:yes gene_type:complete
MGIYELKYVRTYQGKLMMEVTAISEDAAVALLLEPAPAMVIEARLLRILRVERVERG